MLSKRKATAGCALLLLALALSGCSKKPAAPASSAQIEIGTASWYGVPFNGRLTASGEIYDMEKMTAAHRTLPFGAVVRVQSQVNQQTTEVRITDRGPFVQGRIIDLSHAAAQAINMPGTASVRLEVISMPPRRAAEMYAVQVGAFAQRADAEQLRTAMAQKFGTANLVFRPGDETWRVLVGLQPTEEAASALAPQVEREAGAGFVVLVDSDQ